MKKIISLFFASLLLISLPALAENPTATGTLHGVKDGGKMVDVSHEPIPSIGWPAMRMDMKVAPGTDLSNIKPETPITFSLEKGPDGIYQVKDVQEKK